MLYKFPHATVDCHVVCFVLCIVELCSDIFDHRVRMLSTPAVLGSDEFGLCIGLGAQGGSQIRTGRDDFAGGGAVLPMQSEGLKIELTDFEEENATLNGDFLRHVVEIMIGGVPTVMGLVLCACACLSAESYYKAPYPRICSAQSDIKWSFRQSKSASNSLEISI